MKTRNLKGLVTLGSLTAAAALLAGLSTASAQATAPGAGSFPQSFLIPGTNTSIAIYGIIKTVWYYDPNQHQGNTQVSPGTAGFAIGSLALNGPGIGQGLLNTNYEERNLTGGLNGFGEASTFSLETRTPSDLGEIKTVMSFDAAQWPNQALYNNISGTLVSTKPSTGSGNAYGVRLLWAYGTVGPWLLGQYDSAWSDPLLNPDQIGDPGFNPGLVTTANIRQSQIRYTYLAGNGLTLSASIEQTESGTMYVQRTTSGPVAATFASNGQQLTPYTMYPGAVATMGTDNTDVGGVNNFPSFNTGFAWDQPWGHMMGRIGVADNQIRNGVQTLNIFQTNGSVGNSLSRTGFAVEAGGYINTWGNDQWKFLVSYDDGIANYNSDLSGSNTGSMFCNGYTGSCNLIAETSLYTDYVHRFSPNWRIAGDIGVGFFSKPSAAAGLTSVGSTIAPGASNIVAGSNAQLASLERRHWDSHLWAIWSPVPGLTDFGIGWDHWDRQVYAYHTGVSADEIKFSGRFYW